ncbi:MAG TPA: zf-HC2 domain-containing protein [Acidimicrobiales bacterium]|nr:zf-HC2 domain-containing protein [Acidimicrobiales bacterium]
MNGPRRFTPLGCEEVGELAAEFALGLLVGAERAAVVAHLEGCRQCGAQVADLAEAGEQMLVVSPIVEPPAGFEQRVLARLAPLGPPVAPRRRRWRGTTLAVAAAVALVLGTAGLVLRYTGDEPAPTEPAPAERLAATLVSARGNRDVGDVVLTEADPMVLDLDMADWMEEIDTWGTPPTGPWSLHVTRAGGSHEEHVVPLADDSTPQVSLESGSAAVEKVWITDGTGRRWCSADL